MEDITAELHLGSVKTTGGSHLIFSLKVHSNGTGFIQIYAGSSDGRRAGTVLFLGEGEYNQLKSIIGKAEQAIQDLRQTGRMQVMRFQP